MQDTCYGSLWETQATSTAVVHLWAIVDISREPRSLQEGGSSPDRKASDDGFIPLLRTFLSLLQSHRFSFFLFCFHRSGLYCIFACASGGCSAGPPSLDYTVHFFKPLTCDEDDWWWAVRTVFVWVCMCFCTCVYKSGVGFGRKIDLKSPNKYCFLSNLLETR